MIQRPAAAIRFMLRAVLEFAQMGERLSEVKVIIVYGYNSD